MDNFYITLYSDLSNKKYNNSISSFNTDLASTIQLEGNWEVGLASISYTKSFVTITNKQEIEFYYYEKGVKSFTEKAQILKNHFLDIVSLLNYLNECITTAETAIKKNFKFKDLELPKFELDKTDFVKIILKTHKKCLIFPKLPLQLSHVLGFDGNKINLLD